MKRKRTYAAAGDDDDCSEEWNVVNAY